MTTTTRREFLLATTALGASGFATGCRKRTSETVVYTSVDQPFAEPILKEVEAKTGIKIRAVYDTEETKSTGVLNRLVAEADNPQADIFWSGDPVRPLVLAKRGLLDPYVSSQAAAVPERFRSNDGLYSCIGARARVLLVSTKKSPQEKPRTIRDLVDPKWKGQVAMANPLFGTTTMHVAALAVAWGDAELQKFLQAVKQNGARIAASNGEVKRLVVAGEVAFGLTDSDDADEAVKDGGAVAIVLPDQDAFGTLVMPTSIVRIRRGPHPEDSKRVVDALLSADTERKLAESGAHMPLRTDTVVPAGVRRAHEIRAMSVDFARVADAMERLQPWLRIWVGV